MVVGVVIDVVTAGVVGREELDFLADLLVFVLDACWDNFFCAERLEVWHLKVAFFAL